MKLGISDMQEFSRALRLPLSDVKLAGVPMLFEDHGLVQIVVSDGCAICHWGSAMEAQTLYAARARYPFGYPLWTTRSEFEALAALPFSLAPWTVFTHQLLRFNLGGWGEVDGLVRDAETLVLADLRRMLSVWEGVWGEKEYSEGLVFTRVTVSIS